MTSSHLLTGRGGVDAAHLQQTHCRCDDPCAIAGLHSHQNSERLLLNLHFCRAKKDQKDSTTENLQRSLHNDLDVGIKTKTIITVEALVKWRYQYLMAEAARW